MSAPAADWLPKKPIVSEKEQAQPVPTEFPDIAWRGIFAEYRAAMDGTTEASDVAHFATLWAALPPGDNTASAWDRASRPATATCLWPGHS